MLFVCGVNLYVYLIPFKRADILSSPFKKVINEGMTCITCIVLASQSVLPPCPVGPICAASTLAPSSPRRILTASTLSPRTASWIASYPFSSLQRTRVGFCSRMFSKFTISVARMAFFKSPNVYIVVSISCRSFAPVSSAFLS